MPELVLIAHDVRSSHNVGSLLRSADGLGIKTVYLTGYTPYPQLANDPRLPHESKKVSAQIAKTALGAEKALLINHCPVETALGELRGAGYEIIALEQHPRSIPLDKFKPKAKMALIVGNEVQGIEEELLGSSDRIVEITMLGTKESLNVAVAAAIAIYELSR